VIETVKFCRKLLLRIHDLLPFERTVYWVELSDLVAHTNCVLLNYRPQVSSPYPSGTRVGCGGTQPRLCRTLPRSETRSPKSA
jgi:hypothetical protein